MEVNPNIFADPAFRLVLQAGFAALVWIFIIGIWGEVDW